MYQANGGTNQRMRIKYVSEDGGYYRITSAVSGLSFDVYNSKNAAKNNGANVQLYTPSNGDNQKWAITKLSDGGYKIWSLISGKVLDIFGGSPRNEANVRTWDENDSPGQVFDFIRLADAPSNKTVDDGDYVISNVNNEFKVVDVYKGCSSSKNGSNVEIYDANGSSAQKFYFAFTYDSLTGGYYSIIHSASGKALDVYGASLKSGANVQIWNRNSSAAQKWLVKEIGSGIYNIVMMASGNVLDIRRGNLSNGTNITVYKPNGGTNQQFVLKPYADVETELTDGVYNIVSKQDENKVIGLDDGAGANGSNIRALESNDGINQKFIIQNYGNGKYRLMSCVNGRVVDVFKGCSANGTKIISWTNNNGTNQRFSIRKTGDGSYYIVSVGGKAIGIASDGSTIEINDANGSESQKFTLRKITNYCPVKDGAYVIESAKDDGYAVDVYHNGTMQKVNIQLYQKNGGNNQIFKFEQGTDGLYHIRNVYSRHVLDVDHGYLSDGANVMQYALNKGLNQKWLVILNIDGTVSLINSATGKALNIAGNICKNEANINQWTYTGADAQKFSLTATEYDHSLDERAVDYRIYSTVAAWAAKMNSIANATGSATLYQLIVDRATNHVGVYQKTNGLWNAIAFWSCATGASRTPTPAGIFKVGQRGYSFGHGYTCYYWTGFIGTTYLFHSTLYRQGTMSPLDSRLGQNLSHGCVRLAIQNAKWIYDHIPSGTTVRVY